MPKVILASGSPRRKELLGMLNIPFDVITSDIDETINMDNDLVSEIEDLSYRKAFAVFKDHKDSIVIGSDTIVTINGKVLGKPKDRNNAIEMIRELSGNVHAVVTAVSIISSTHSDTFSRVSRVFFNRMSDKEIEEYVDSGEPMDKAGAYAIQGGAAKFISRIEGDYYAVIGLPVSEVYQRLKNYL